MSGLVQPVVSWCMVLGACNSLLCCSLSLRSCSTDGDGGVAFPWYLRSVTARHQRGKLFLRASTLWQKSQLTRCTCAVTWVDHMGLWPEGTIGGSWPSREHAIAIVHVVSGIQVRAVLVGEDLARSNAMSPANLSTKSTASFHCRGIGSWM